MAGMIAKGLLKLLGADDPTKDISAEPYASAKAAGLISETMTVDTRQDWWQIYPERWHEVYPYQFLVTQKSGKSNSKSAFGTSADAGPAVLAIYTLPIPPQAINVRMIPASQVTPTLGGVVEETTANVFWSISLAGTTGTAIGKRGTTAQQLGAGSEGGGGFWDKVSSFFFGDPPKTAAKFRETIKTTGEMSGLFGLLASAASKVGSTVDQFDTMISGGGNAASIAGGASGMIQNALLPTPQFTASAVPRVQNGFGDMQQMHRFLLVYSRLKGAFPNDFALQFRMLKTNQRWDCALQDFQISQNSQQPHLYKYNIQLKCWRIGDASSEDVASKSVYDRFGPKGDLKPVNILSLGDASRGLKKIGFQIG